MSAHSSKAATATSNAIHPSWRKEAPLASQRLSTDEAAQILRVRPQTLRRALCVNGAYCGIRPIKGPNRLLYWPAEEIEALVSGVSQ